MDGFPPELSRRGVLRLAAWSAPVIAAAAAAPAQAASLTQLTVLNETLVFNGDGYQFRLRDGKNAVNMNTASPSNTSIIVARFRVVDASSPSTPVPDAVCFVDGGPQLDGQGHYVLSILPANFTGQILESNVKRTTTAVAGADGRFSVKIGTAFWSKEACPIGYRGPLMPPPGTLTISVSASAGYASATIPFPYLVYNGSGVTCP